MTNTKKVILLTLSLLALAFVLVWSCKIQEWNGSGEVRVDLSDINVKMTYFDEVLDKKFAAGRPFVANRQSGGEYIAHNNVVNPSYLSVLDLDFPSNINLSTIANDAMTIALVKAGTLGSDQAGFHSASSLYTEQEVLFNTVNGSIISWSGNVAHIELKSSTTAVLDRKLLQVQLKADKIKTTGGEFLLNENGNGTPGEADGSDDFYFYIPLSVSYFSATTDTARNNAVKAALPLGYGRSNKIRLSCGMAFTVDQTTYDGVVTYNHEVLDLPFPYKYKYVGETRRLVHRYDNANEDKTSEVALPTMSATENPWESLAENTKLFGSNGAVVSPSGTASVVSNKLTVTFSSLDANKNYRAGLTVPAPGDKHIFGMARRLANPVSPTRTLPAGYDKIKTAQDFWFSPLAPANEVPNADKNLIFPSAAHLNMTVDGKQVAAMQINISTAQLTAKGYTLSAADIGTFSIDNLKVAYYDAASKEVAFVPIKKIESAVFPQKPYFLLTLDAKFFPAGAAPFLYMSPAVKITHTSGRKSLGDQNSTLEIFRIMTYADAVSVPPLLKGFWEVGNNFHHE